MLVEGLLERSARLRPDHIALVCRGERWSYRELNARAGRFAAALVAAGLRRGDRVAVCLDNSVEAVVAIFGTLKAGGVLVVANPQLKSGLHHILADSGASCLVATAGRARLALESGALPRLHTIFTTDDAAADAAPRQIAFAAALATDQAPRDGHRHIDADLACLVYTSGSTGRPKGVMLTHRNLVAAAESITTYLENTPDDVVLSVLPLSFTYGFGQLTTVFGVGATLVLEASFMYPQVILETMARERVTGAPLVPTIATRLLQCDLSKHPLPSLRYLTNAAAALPQSKVEGLRRAFPHVRLYLMYGQTECQRISYLPPACTDTHPVSVGVAIPNLEVAIVDDAGRPVGAGEAGELVVRGATVMKGYWKQPAATRRVLRAGPWPGERVLYTGDLFRAGEDGLLYFLERKDDIIKTRGEKVAPREVEEIISQLPGVADVAVFGVPDDVLGYSVAAVVAAAPQSPLTAADVKRHCMKHLQDFQVPRSVEIRDALPTTMSGKVSRRMLQGQATAG